jgi:hypothetical protein
LKLHFPSRRSVFSFGVALVLMCSARCIAQDHEVVCTDGEGSFQAQSLSGVSVKVGATKTGELSARACEATLRWDKQVVTVATNVAQLDVDAFGIDLGLGVPIAAFQVKNSANQCCMEYKLYSLEKPPRLLRTIKGGDSFSAADTDLDGHVEIWTTDAAAVDGLEKLYLTELDSAPPIVLRFEHSNLLDASAEFQEYYDQQIKSLRAQLTPEDLRNFKNADGKPSLNASSAERLHHSRQVKIKVLEIVWNYLYSGRETQAWRALAEMWPDNDVARIRAALVNARTHGVLAQVAGISAEHSPKKGKRVRIFDATIQSSGGKPEVNPPEAILLWRPPPSETPSQLPQPSESLLELTIDSAGKVRLAESAGRVKVDAALLRATAGWKFIPALDAGRPVASRTRLAVSFRQ